jgi:hypothetical protein
MGEKNMRKHSQEFSKWLLIQESVLIWIITISFIVLSFYCVMNQFFGELPWLAAMVGFPWTAYGVSQTFYYKKATAENTEGGIQYQNLIQDLSNRIDEYEDQSGLGIDLEQILSDLEDFDEEINNKEIIEEEIVDIADSDIAVG